MSYPDANRLFFVILVVEKQNAFLILENQKVQKFIF